MKHMASAVGAGKIRRASRFIREDGRSVLVAIDMQAGSGEGPDLDVVESVAAGGPDGVLASWQIARRYPEAFRRCGLVLRIDGATTMLGDHTQGDEFSLLWRAEQAAAIGADAVVLMVFPGAADEDRSLQRLGTVVAECEKIGMPVIAESIPGGWTRTVPWDTAHISRSGRICIENGADAIKTPAPPDVADVAVVAANCQGPVFILGGPKRDSEDEAVHHAAAVVEAGAAGIAFGRNVWGAHNPTDMVRRLSAAVHGAGGREVDG